MPLVAFAINNNKSQEQFKNPLLPTRTTYSFFSYNAKDLPKDYTLTITSMQTQVILNW